MYKSKRNNALPSFHPGSEVINLPVEGNWILLSVSILNYCDITYHISSGNSHYIPFRMIVKKANNILELL